MEERKKERKKYGVLLNNTYNIGDDLQSVASARFLPTIDYWAFKEQLSAFKSEEGEKVKFILNSWYMWRSDNFPPSGDIDPLPISMHFADSCRKNVLTKKTKEWMLAHGPIGCRDVSTKEWLEENGIPAYFSGCLTLTLQENAELRKNSSWGGYILCLNVSPEVVETIKKRTNRPVFAMDKNLTSYFYAKDRIDISKMYLYLYHQAAAVVTGNMHCAMPSLAVNTPVCLLTSENKGPDVDGRFSGSIDFFHHYTTEEFLANDVYDFNNPPVNSMKHLETREKLIQTCVAFTGYNHEGPTLPSDFDPSFELMKLLNFCRWDYKKTEKAIICHPDKTRLLKLYIKQLLGKDKHDLIQY